MKNSLHSLGRLSALSLALLPLLHATADEFSYPTLLASQSDFGGVGLMQMPTGRMAPEGEFNFATSYNDEYQHFTASVQLFPWFETTVRYTQVQDLLYSSDPSFSGNTKYTDKGIDFKVRLLEESNWLPETSIGVRDFGGTGLFDAEFIAATKRVGPLDFTLGIGWGYIGNSGNLTSDKKDLNYNCDRDTSVGGTGGTVDYQRWFKGCAALFGGVEYQTPWDPLRVKVEYDGNDYQSDFPVVRGGIAMPQDSKFNYGLLYRFGDWGDLHLSYERGNTWTLGFSLQTNFNELTQIKRDPAAAKYKPIPAAPLTHVQTTNTPLDSVNSSEQTPAIASATLDNTTEIADVHLIQPQEGMLETAINWSKVAQDLQSIAGYNNPKIYLDSDSITVVGEQTKFRDRNEAHQRAATILANNSDLTRIKEYRLIETHYSQPITETRIDAEKFAQVVSFGYLNAKITDASQVSVPSLPQGQLVTNSDKNWLDKLGFDISPTMVQSFGGSEGFYMFNIGVTGSANYRFTDNFEFGGSLYLNLYDNYDKFLYDVPPDGTDLKRVRTLIRQYVHDNPVRVNNLQLTWMDNLSDNISYQAYGGYLEMMYGGVGTEFLYRPLNSQWAFGFDVNYAKQRDPDSMFGFFKDENQFDPLTNRAYRVQTGVVTGHATAYYQPEWFPNTLLRVSAGQYLTEDKGVTVDFSKQFDSGVIVGAFATKTNLSADEYGEGSFTKGFYISIPFDLMTVKSTHSRAFLSWMPLTRDGGQMLGRKYNLFDVTDARAPWYTRPSVDPIK
ncbi:YjbH domain-containing protein [Shewanella sp. SM34]|uniref:YjbH domain-containing protein n=1 Tax=unclassified Shewanella TaxID=196818 RepID=UPI0021D85396|nr:MULTISPECIES: YjbH domain-containing protein [unclassified Shewanella]MCU8055581.1 YjbH domain-containing protein [Shewanella sp. SM35]MCU8064503.1 YjbH domain-containing protein [Shewanella sp. SM34]